MVLRAAGLIMMGCLALAAGMGCSQVQVPFMADEEDPSVYPERVQDVLRDVERLVGRNRLRQAIELVESTRVDYPEATALKIRMAELRSMRQVCFASDWSEADDLCGQHAHAQAILVLQRIEGYGDPDMVHRAGERIASIRAAHPD